MHFIKSGLNTLIQEFVYGGRVLDLLILSRRKLTNRRK